MGYIRALALSLFLTVPATSWGQTLLGWGPFFPDTVEELDLERYLGTWYEIASTQPPFQEGCVCNKAEYVLREDGLVGVTNTCRQGTPSGEPDVAEGTAEPTEDPGKFIVSFGGVSLPFPNYWVVELAPDYSYAVVSSFFGRPIWILAREPQIPADRYQAILDRLAEREFAVDKIQPTPQEGCWPEE